MSAYAGPVLVLAMRSCADLATRARARRDTTHLTQAQQDAARLVEMHDDMKIDPMVVGPMRVTGDAVRLSWNAEQARVAGADTHEHWAAAAQAWIGHERPHRAAYALLRQTEALLRERGHSVDAAKVLTSAGELAGEHVPLHDAITDLARRARVPIGTRPTNPERPVQPAPLGLTDRERSVLALVADGLSNAEIGASLYMSPKTASVHVSSILRKLDVATRAHAAVIAQRSGILDDVSSDERND